MGHVRSTWDMSDRQTFLGQIRFDITGTIYRFSRKLKHYCAVAVQGCPSVVVANDLEQ